MRKKSPREGVHWAPVFEEILCTGFTLHRTIALRCLMCMKETLIGPASTCKRRGKGFARMSSMRGQMRKHYEEKHPNW